MSAILGVFSPEADLLSDEVAKQMLLRARRGRDHVESWKGEGALLGVARARWETESAFSGANLIARRDACTVACDASLYYRDEHREALTNRGVPPAGDTVGDLIAASYTAWGEDCVHRLEGDFAWVLWDAATRTALGVRDPVGTRPLYFATVKGVLVVASSIAAVIEYPGCPDELNRIAVAQAAAGLFASSRETCYRAVSLLPAGSMLVWRDGRARLVRYWSPPPIEERDSTPFEHAAEELRHLLGRAVAERTDNAGRTSIWLSGGWDSPAILAAGRNFYRDLPDPPCLRAVSISYPPGDPGREDELIEAIASRWSIPVHWLDIRGIPLFSDPQGQAEARDEPFAHAFEGWNRALARGSVQAGARVALSGVGGDFLFSVSPIYLADLFRAGRWGAVIREWKRRGIDQAGGLRSLFRWAVQPNLPRLLGRSLPLVGGPDQSRAYLDRVIPDWIEPGFARDAALEERERADAPARRHRSHAAHEMHWALTYPYGPRIMACVFGLGLGEGVEIRSPFFDSRLLRFAAARPVSERASGRETKRLLRHAMTGLLPDPVLAPRSTRTGVTSSYLVSSLRGPFSSLLRDVFAKPILGDLGIVDAAILRRRCNTFLQVGGENLAIQLFLTLQTELWLRSRQESIRV